MTPARPDDRFIAHSLRTSMYFTSTRLLVRGNPKAAGTTLRWWLLQAHGVDVAAVVAESLWNESGPAQAVWDERVDLRYTWARLADVEQHEALTAADVLSVHPIRHPQTRAFAAWASKYLTLEPHYHERLPKGFPFAPDRIDSTAQITTMYAAFLHALEAHVTTHGWEDIDVHFWPQHRLLAPAAAGPVLVLRQEDMTTGLTAIAEQLTAHRIDPPPVPRINESVVPYRPELVNPLSAGTVARLYDADFRALDYDTTPPSGSSREVDLAWLNDVRGRNRRYAVMCAAAARRRDEASSHGANQQQLTRQLATVTTQRDALLTSTSWRVTAPLRWLSERTHRR
jgi:hypothetical protein